MSLRDVGRTRDGHPVRLARLTWPDGLEVEVLELGAIVHTLALPDGRGRRRNVVLNLDDVAAYEADTSYIGQCVGRVANRIAGGRFPLDGESVRVSVNEPPNTLHGGEVGFGQRMWRFDEAACDDRQIVAAYTSVAGDEGFPGRVEVRCRFELTAPDTLEIAYAASIDAPTPVNLSHHLYFNLLGGRTTDILDHVLRIDADAITPVGAGLIPIGEVASVAGGPFDLREGARIGDVLARGGDQLALADGIDFNWALTGRAGPAIDLTAPDGTRLEVETDQAGIQVYGGQGLGAPFGAHGGLAIEPQGFPDAVNHDRFPSQIVRPGQTYRRTTRYRLTAG